MRFRIKGRSSYQVNTYHIGGATQRRTFSRESEAKNFAKEQRKQFGPSSVEFLAPKEVAKREKIQEEYEEDEL